MADAKAAKLAAKAKSKAQEPLIFGTDIQDMFDENVDEEEPTCEKPK